MNLFLIDARQTTKEGRCLRIELRVRSCEAFNIAKVNVLSSSRADVNTRRNHRIIPVVKIKVCQQDLCGEKP